MSTTGAGSPSGPAHTAASARDRVDARAPAPSLVRRIPRARRGTVKTNAAGAVVGPAHTAAAAGTVTATGAGAAVGPAHTASALAMWASTARRCHGPGSHAAAAGTRRPQARVRRPLRPTPRRRPRLSPMRPSAQSPVRRTLRAVRARFGSRVALRPPDLHIPRPPRGQFPPQAQALRSVRSRPRRRWRNVDDRRRRRDRLHRIPHQRRPGFGYRLGRRGRSAADRRGQFGSDRIRRCCRSAADGRRCSGSVSIAGSGAATGPSSSAAGAATVTAEAFAAALGPAPTAASVGDLKIFGDLGAIGPQPTTSATGFVGVPRDVTASASLGDRRVSAGIGDRRVSASFGARRATARIG